MLRDRLAEGLALLRVGDRLLEADAGIGRAPAAMPRRSLLKLSMISVKPWPSSPIRFSPGTRQSSKYSVAVSDAHQPIFLSVVRDRPGVSPSISSRLTPPAPSAAGAHRDRDVVGAHARGDEGLLAVDDVVVAVAPRLGAQVGDVGAAARLGDGERRDLLARQHLRQHPRLHLRARGAAIGGEPMVWLIRLALTPPEPARASSCVAMIRMKWSAAMPPYSSGKPRPAADRGRLVIELARKLAGLVPFVGMGLDLARHEAAHHVAERFVLRRVERALRPGTLQHISLPGGHVP